MALGQFRRDSFQIFLIKTHTCDFYGTIPVDQETGRHIGQTVSVGSGVAFSIQRNWKGDTVLVGEFLGSASVVLGYTEKCDDFAAIPFVQPFQKRKGELANGTGNLEERHENWPLF